MKAMIEIPLYNVAFADKEGWELSRILHQLADMVKHVGTFCEEDVTRLRDINDNLVVQMFTHRD